MIGKVCCTDATVLPPGGGEALMRGYHAERPGTLETTILSLLQHPMVQSFYWGGLGWMGVFSPSITDEKGAVIPALSPDLLLT